MNTLHTSKEVMEEILQQLSPDSNWSLKEAYTYYTILSAQQVVLPPLGIFFADVRAYREEQQAESRKAKRAMAAQQKANQKLVTQVSEVKQPVIYAEKKICKELHHQHVYLGTIEGIGTEFDSLDQFYCPECNAFWCEP